MSAVKHSVIIVAYGMFAAMTALVLPARLPEVHTELGITIGIALFMLGALLHQYLAKNDRDAAVDDHVDALYRAYHKLAEEIDLLREEARTVRKGLAEMIERTCRHAQRFAEGLQAAGYPILNDVVINQVLVSFGDAETTRRVIAGIQADGTCWCGSTVWQGHTAMRISVSSWATTDEDVERSLAAMLRVAKVVNP